MSGLVWLLPVECIEYQIRNKQKCPVQTRYVQRLHYSLQSVSNSLFEKNSLYTTWIKSACTADKICLPMLAKLQHLVINIYIWRWLAAWYTSRPSLCHLSPGSSMVRASHWRSEGCGFIIFDILIQDWEKGYALNIYNNARFLWRIEPVYFYALVLVRVRPTVLKQTPQKCW